MHAYCKLNNVHAIFFIWYDINYVHNVLSNTKRSSHSLIYRHYKTNFVVIFFQSVNCPIYNKDLHLVAVLHVLNHHPDSHTGLEIAFLCTDRREPLDNLELAKLAESPIIKLDSLEERESWAALDTVLFALLGRLLDTVFEYCFCFICSLSNESLDKLLVGFTA